MNNTRGSLPVKGSLKQVYIFSIVIAVLAVFVSLAGIITPYRVYKSDELLQAFMPNDIVNLAVGLPALLGSMWAARNGSLAGLLCWPGALLFMVYNYLAYVFAMPVGRLFLFYLSIAAAGIYTLAGLLCCCDSGRVSKILEASVPEKAAGGILAGLGALFMVRVVIVVITALQDGLMPPDAEFAVNISDFLISPAWIIGGIHLVRHKASGYLTALGLLFQGSMLFVALIIYLIIKPVLTNVPFSAVDLTVIFVMGMICFIPFALFLRGARRKAGLG